MCSRKRHYVNRPFSNIAVNRKWERVTGDYLACLQSTAAITLHLVGAYSLAKDVKKHSPVYEAGACIRLTGMIKAALPPDEAFRLIDLASYEIIDSAPENDFDEIVELAVQICGTPVSLINLLKVRLPV